jgi:hypothetical protein
VYRLYPVAYVGTMLGLIIYNIYPATKPRIKGDGDEQNNEEEKGDAREDARGDVRENVKEESRDKNNEANEIVA